MTTDTEYQPGCHRVERDGLVIARYITVDGQIRWHVLYERSAPCETLGDILNEIEASR